MTFDLRTNPFFVLGLSPRDPNTAMVERTETLLADGKISEDTALKIQSELSASRSRLNAELSWLPELTPTRALDIKAQYLVPGSASSSQLSSLLNDVEGLACANLSAHSCSFGSADQDVFRALIRSWGDLHPANVRDLVNSNRKIAGYPEISDELLTSGLQLLKELHTEAALIWLIASTHPGKTLSSILGTHLKEKSLGRDLLQRILERYESWSIPKLSSFEDQISSKFKSMKEKPDTGQFHNEVLQLLSLLREWDEYSQPLQLFYQDKGLDEPRARRVFSEARDIGIWLANEKGEYGLSLTFSQGLQDVFQELPTASEKIVDDSRTLTGLIARSNEEKESFAREVALDLELGWGKRLVINSDAIHYGSKIFRLLSVDRTRWGIFIQYVNGIPHNYYTIWFGSADATAKIECVKTFQSLDKAKERYELILEKLWKAVVGRRITEVLSDLNSRKNLNLCDLNITNEGIELRRKKFLFSEPVFCKWSDMAIGTGPGVFQISHKDDSKIAVQLSYRDIWNVHVLEAVMRFLWKDGNHIKLSRGTLSEK